MTHNPAEALREIVSMIDNCADVPRDPDSLMMMVLAHAKVALSPAPAGGEVLTFQYRNHRGETAVRRAQECSLRFGSSEWYPERQWLLRAFDVDKSDYREFAVKNILSFAPASEPVQELHELPPLRKFADDFVETSEIAKLMNEAATLLESLSAEKGRLIEAQRSASNDDPCRLGPEWDDGSPDYCP